jgi:hypothetical protein
MCIRVIHGYTRIALKSFCLRTVLSATPLTGTHTQDSFFCAIRYSVSMCPEFGMEFGMEDTCSDKGNHDSSQIYQAWEIPLL